MTSSDSKMTGYIITFQRRPENAPESYYVIGRDERHATERGLRLVRNTDAKVLEVRPV
jgi:hypothetical protein